MKRCDVFIGRRRDACVALEVHRRAGGDSAVQPGPGLECADASGHGPELVANVGLELLKIGQQLREPALEAAAVFVRNPFEGIDEGDDPGFDGAEVQGPAFADDSGGDSGRTWVGATL